MSTSPHKGRLLTGRTWDANAAIDAGFARDFALNNACHLADVYGQVRVAWSLTSTALDDQDVSYGQPLPVTLNEWLWMGSFGLWSIPLRSDGSPYRLRVRVGARNPDTCSGKIRVVIAPNKTAADRLVAADADYVFETETITDSLVLSWRSGTSQGTNAYEAMIEIPSALASTWITNVTTLDDIGGNSTGCQQCLVSAHVYGYATAVVDADTSAVVVGGLYLAEWVGVDT